MRLYQPLFNERMKSTCVVLIEMNSYAVGIA